MTLAKRTCTVCGKPALNRCKYCGDTLCREHIPPEMHWCVGEEYKRDHEARGTSASTTAPEFRPEWGEWEEDKRGSKTPLDTFSGNYSFLLLFLISISFVLQLLIPGYTQHFIPGK